MRKISAFVVCFVLLFASSGFSQSRSQEAERKHRVGLYKLIAGCGLAGVGASLAMAGAFSPGASEEKQFLPIGLAMAGGGGFLIWNGIGDMDRSKRMPALGFTVNKKGAAVAFRKSW
jgi:hypothetical protein